jgi:hypothetical protein
MVTENYKTPDIVLAASLKVCGFDLESIELVGSKGIFVFKDVDKQFLLDFDLGKIVVEPVIFNNTIKQLTTSVRRMSS